MTLDKPTPQSNDEQSSSLNFHDAFSEKQTREAKHSQHHEPGAQQHCPISPVYRDLTTFAARNIYDPKSFPPLHELVKRHTCDAKTNLSAMMAAHFEMMKTGDPFNAIEPPDTAKKMEFLRTGIQRSIGVHFQSFEGKSPEPSTLIDAVLPNSPAAKAHLQRGDAIAKINGKNARKYLSDDVKDAIYEAGKKVNLTVIRDGKEIHRTLAPQDLHVPTVDDPVDKGDGIAYIRVREYGATTDKQLQDAMSKMPNAKAFVVDLRENGGGVMNAAIRGSELFIDHGNIMSSRERVESNPAHPQYALERDAVSPTKELTTHWKEGESEPKPEETDRLPNLLGNRKLYVLQNGNSASSAEIMIGALHDTAHATTIGEPSFGKGIYQLDAPNIAAGASVHVTQGHYFTPSGYWPGDANKHKHPMQPDKRVPNPPRTLLNTADDEQLNYALGLARKELGNTP